MGFLSSLAGNDGRPQPPLAPVPYPLGVIPFFTQHQQEIVLKIREKKFSMSGDDFGVKDARTGQVMFKVDGKSLSLRDEKGESRRARRGETSGYTGSLASLRSSLADAVFRCLSISSPSYYTHLLTRASSLSPLSSSNRRKHSIARPPSTSINLTYLSICQSSSPTSGTTDTRFPTPIATNPGSQINLSRHHPVVKDARGQPLFSIKHKLIAIHSTYYGVHPQSNDTLFTVKSGFSFGTKLTATFKNLAGGAASGHVEEELVLRGDLLDRSAEIMTKQGVVVARISRSFLNMGEMFCESAGSSLRSCRVRPRSIPLSCTTSTSIRSVLTRIISSECQTNGKKAKARSKASRRADLNAWVDMVAPER